MMSLNAKAFIATIITFTAGLGRALSIPESRGLGESLSVISNETTSNNSFNAILGTGVDTVRWDFTPTWGSNNLDRGDLLVAAVQAALWAATPENAHLSKSNFFYGKAEVNIQSFDQYSPVDISNDHIPAILSYILFKLQPRDQPFREVSVDVTRYYNDPSGQERRQFRKVKLISRREGTKGTNNMTDSSVDMISFDDNATGNNATIGIPQPPRPNYRRSWTQTWSAQGQQITPSAFYASILFFAGVLRAYPRTPLPTGTQIDTLGSRGFPLILKDESTEEMGDEARLTVSWAVEMATQAFKLAMSRQKSGMPLFALTEDLTWKEGRGAVKGLWRLTRPVHPPTDVSGNSNGRHETVEVQTS